MNLPRTKSAMSLSLPGLAWLLFFAAVFASWWLLLMLGARHQAAAPFYNSVLGALDPDFDLALWKALCLTPVGDLDLFAAFGMWALMSLAMMAPTAVPLLISYRHLQRSGGMPNEVQCFLALMAGYLAVWIGYALPMAVLQHSLALQSLVNSHGVLLSDGLTVALLLAAGSYQFSRLKDACLSKCRSPISFFMAHWKAGISGAFEMGLRHGLICLGCCWALMLLAFVGGTMNLVWMAVAMILMTLEKLPDLGRYVTRPLGALLIMAAIIVLGRMGGQFMGV